MSQIKRFLAQALAGLAFVAAAMSTGGASAEDKVVNVYNWSDYIDTSILTDFTKETGIKVVYDVFDSNELVETKLLTGGTGYDVVVPTGSFLARQIKAGVFQKLDKAKLPNLKYMDPEIMKRLAVYDPGNQYAIDYMWGTTGLGLNVKEVQKRLGKDQPLDTWALLFDPKLAAKLADCGIYVLDTADEVVPAALIYLGLDPNSNDPKDLAKVKDLLMKIRPYIRKFHSSEYIQALANGDICMAHGWSGDVLQARDRAKEAKQGVEIKYVIPREGAVIWLDNMAIPADAPHPGNALTFMNYIMRPEVIAKSTNVVNYASGNLAAKKYVNKDILDDPGVYPPAATMKRLTAILPKDPKAQRLQTRLWTSIVTGQ
ncbi:polyamine ABC transporter substrate-binding protein [Jiella sp. MQZ9-1]|uniref:Putrescine-binding periplasmic protein n=1 Tax=Jiella flava TaxID=2816857 RepID=A0A939JSY0_9HYPH|nr:polyamine ABC transporter substrate-binding protein [Jiella flava]MBO0661565.1 polyamine ABC transporter substrate-binding protein [Jiella flava]MCD2470207.1 polyamine ABC transporter substrate-binding protein [Jiella flava]